MGLGKCLGRGWVMTQVQIDIVAAATARSDVGNNVIGSAHAGYRRLHPHDCPNSMGVDMFTLTDLDLMGATVASPGSSNVRRPGAVVGRPWSKTRRRSRPNAMLDR